MSELADKKTDQQEIFDAYFMLFKCEWTQGVERK